MKGQGPTKKILLSISIKAELGPLPFKERGNDSPKATR